MCNFLKSGQGHLHTKSVIVFVYGYYYGLFCKYVNTVLLNEREKDCRHGEASHIRMSSMFLSSQNFSLCHKDGLKFKGLFFSVCHGSEFECQPSKKHGMLNFGLIFAC